MPAIIDETVENVRETPKKIVSLRYWVFSLIDAMVIGGIGGVITSGVLDVSGNLEFTWESFWWIFGAAALVKIGDFWRTNPLAHVVRKRA